MKKSLEFVRVLKNIVIPMNTETNVVVDCTRSDTLILEPTNELYIKRKTLMARGLAEAKSEVPFLVRMVSFGDIQ